MGESETDCDEFEWTPENLQQLFSALKSSIPNRDKNVSYHKGLKNVDWETVAFPPFSASECKEKWTEILRTLYKFRSLTELIAVAESNLNSMCKYYPNGRHIPNANAIFIKENYANSKREHPEMGPQELLAFINRKFSQLSKEQKAKYERKAQCGRKEYLKKKNRLRKQCLQTANRKRKQDEDEPPAEPPAEPAAEPAAEPPAGPPAEPRAKLPNSGFNLFCMNRTAKYSKMSKHWREMSEMQREEYRTQCKKLNKANSSQQLKRSGLPSDSEDGDIVCSSDEEDDNHMVVDYEKDGEQEGQEESFIFEMY